MSERTERSEGHERMPEWPCMSERTERSEGHERMPEWPCMSARPPATRTAWGAELSTVRSALCAELLKLATLPAVWCSVLGIAMLTAATGVTVPDAGSAVAAYTQAGFLVLGVLAATSEYAGGQLRSTLLAVPRRIPGTVAKVAALGLTGAVVAAAAVGAVVTFAPAPATGAAAAAAYLPTVTLLAGAVGTLLRAPLPALTALLGWFLVVAPLARGHGRWVGYLPDVPPADDPLPGTVVLLGWTVVLLAAATAAVHRRDA